MASVRTRKLSSCQASGPDNDDVPGQAGSSWPAVMLSPNATNFVALILGGPATATPKLHDAACCRASRAAQVTVVVPTLNGVPLAGVHVAVTGAAPPDTVGAG